MENFEFISFVSEIWKENIKIFFSIGLVLFLVKKLFILNSLTIFWI